jgi:hypothetical protein
MRQPLETPPNKHFCGAPEHDGLVDDATPAAFDWTHMARAASDTSERQAAAEHHNKSHQSAAEIEPERLQRLRHLMDNDVSLKRAYSEFNDQRRRGEAAATSIEALMATVLRDERRS